jgi:HAD superfamily hydrolase (TIGR01509 family)
VFHAVLWDLDGTLVDTEPIWMAGELALAAAHGAEWTEADGLAQVGNALLVTGRYMKARLGSDLTAEAIVDRLVMHVASALAETVPWRPGALDLVAAYKRAGVPQALVTMSYEPIAAAVARHLPVEAVVTGDMVTHGKPHPEAYLTAADLLGIDPAQCLAIEDSPKGAAAANAAGCHVLVIPHFVDVPDAPQRVLHATLEHLSPASIATMLGTPVGDRMRPNLDS